MVEEQRPWHRLFGLSWQDFFRDAPVTVELEKDLSQRQQLLDLVILHMTGGLLPRRLPDGFDDLGRYNLVSFKSYQEALDAWTLLELLGHYVNCRKQVSPSMQDLLPESDFRLFAVCVRHPRELARQVTLEPIQEGVYAVRHYSGLIRVIVINQLPRQEHNAMLHLFSANQELVEYGARNYRPYSAQTSTLLHTLFMRYQKEGLPMPMTLQEIARETVKEIMKDMRPGERLEGLSPGERLEGLSPGERLEGLSPGERLEGLSAEKRLEGLSADDLLNALTPEIRAALAKRLQEEQSRSKGE